MPDPAAATPTVHEARWANPEKTVARARLDDGHWFLRADDPRLAGVAVQNFEEAPAPVPAEVSRFQFRAALRALPGAGLLGSGATAYDRAALWASSKGGQTKNCWDEADRIPRNARWVEAMRADLGMTTAQMDSLFVAAASLTQ